MNYWFLYNLSDGSIYGSPYLGFADKWTNIPEGCGVLGAISESDATETIKDAFSNPRKYKVVDGNIVLNIEYIEPTPVQQIPTYEDRLSAVENAITALMGV